MIKLAFFLLSLLYVSPVLHASPAIPQSDLKVTMQNWQVRGTSDYYLHYSPGGQTESLVRMPQNQPMLLVRTELAISNHNFLGINVGSTNDANKGTGFDADWAAGNATSHQYYGNIDFYGSQSLFELRIGHKLGEGKSLSKTYFGFSQLKSTNELQNVVYHVINFTNVGNLTQLDNGSVLNMNSWGPTIGIENNRKLNSKITLVSNLNLSYLTTTAHGEWNNHDPAWAWDNNGHSLGYAAEIGLKYQVNHNIESTIGYRASYYKMTGGNEILNLGDGSIVNLDQLIDIKQKNSGIFYGFNAKF